jgi:hypothetical protein
VDALLADPRTRQTAEKILARYFGQSEWMSLDALGSGGKWNERAYREAPLRHFYMTKGIPYEEVENMIAEFNKLL